MPESGCLGLNRSSVLLSYACFEQVTYSPVQSPHPLHKDNSRIVMRITNDFKYVKCLLIKYFQVVSLMMNVFNTGTVNNLFFSFFWFLSMITNLPYNSASNNNFASVL